MACKHHACQWQQSFGSPVNDSIKMAANQQATRPVGRGRDMHCDNDSNDSSGSQHSRSFASKPTQRSESGTQTRLWPDSCALAGHFIRHTADSHPRSSRLMDIDIIIKFLFNVLNLMYIFSVQIPINVCVFFFIYYNWFLSSSFRFQVWVTLSVLTVYSAKNAIKMSKNAFIYFVFLILFFLYLMSNIK